MSMIIIIFTMIIIIKIFYILSFWSESKFRVAAFHVLHNHVWQVITILNNADLYIFWILLSVVDLFHL